MSAPASTSDRLALLHHIQDHGDLLSLNDRFALLPAPCPIIP